VFGCVVDLQPLGETERLLGREGFVEGPDAVGVEVVHHQHDLLRVGVVLGEEPLDLAGPVEFGPLGLGVDAPPAFQGFDPAEHRAGSVADVLGVFLAVMSGAGRNRVPGVAEQLVRRLVHADLRPGRVVGAGVDGKNVLHPGSELGVPLRRDLLQMRTKFRFFKIRPMVE